MKKRIVGISAIVLVLMLISSILMHDVKATEARETMTQTRQEITTANKIEMDPVNISVEEDLKSIQIPTEGSEFAEPNPTENYQNYFSDDITFSKEYICDGDVMPYALYTPSTEESEEKPLIVWLHGSGEVNVDANTFLERGLPRTLNNWSMDGFDAYILCPHLTGRWNSGVWNMESAKNNLQTLMEKFIMEHNVDIENIIIVGHSLGGQGALYMAHELTDYFSRCVVLSGYYSGIDNSEIDIPTIGYVGRSYAGEDGASIYYMETAFVPVFGTQNFFSIEASHGMVPKVAFYLDENHNNHSDLIEWMLGELEFIQ